MNIIKYNDIWHELEFRKDSRDKEYKDDIYLIQQFFIHRDIFRNHEIRYCLKNNINNIHFKKIILLNEKEYTKEELGLNDKQMKRIEQVIIGNRLTYKNVLDYVFKEKLKGYIIFSNSDIFLDNSIKNVFRTSLFKGKCWYAQLRIEAYTKKLYGPNPHAQDTWIFHSNCKIKNTKPFNFILGKLGCDNIVAYECVRQNIYVYNQPLYIRTFHVHKSTTRDYNINDRLPPPYLRIRPLLE